MELEYNTFPTLFLVVFMSRGLPSKLLNNKIHRDFVVDEPYVHEE